VTAAALAEGRLVPAKARVMAVAVNERIEERFAADEAMLVDQAVGLTVDQTATVMRSWAMRADQDGPDDDDCDDDNLHVSQTFGGRWRLDGGLDAECGGIVSTVLEALKDELYRAIKNSGGERLSPTRLRAAALVEMARRATAAGDRPSARPLVWVMADLTDLERRAGVAELVGAGPISAEAARRLACDAGVARVLTGPGHAVVDLGLTERTASPTQRRLLAIRDGGCAFPGCDRPPGWCRAHHLIHWVNNGPTDLDNLCLLCSHHHHLVHEGRHRVRRTDDGTLEFTRPDGTAIHAPPIAA
jgi:hypothetical protein